MDILDELQSIDDRVKIILRNGKTLIGYADCIVYDEDDEGYDTVKLLRFEPDEGRIIYYLKPEDIGCYEVLGIGDG